MARAETPSRRRGRGSDARGRARASVVVAEVDRRCPAKTSGRSPFHPIWKRSRAVAWPLAPRTRVRSRGRRDTGTLLEAEASRDRLERGSDPRRAWRAGDGRHPGSSWRADLHGPPAKHGLGRPGGSHHAQASWVPRGSDRGVRGTASPGSVRKNDAARQPETAHQSGSGVLNRQVPRPPSSRAQAPGEGARREPRRDAGNELWRECS